MTSQITLFGAAHCEPCRVWHKGLTMAGMLAWLRSWTVADGHMHVISANFGVAHALFPGQFKFVGRVPPRSLTNP